MGTRGTYGFKRNGELHLTYNHYDSYYSGLGQDIVNAIEYAGSIDKLNETFESIVFVEEDKEPTIEQIEECKKYSNLNVSEQSLKDWYCLLREAQGDLIPYIDKNLKYMVEGNDFINDVGWCEYYYIINLDEDVLELGTEYGSDASIEIPLEEIFKGDISLKDYMEKVI